MSYFISSKALTPTFFVGERTLYLQLAFKTVVSRIPLLHESESVMLGKLRDDNADAVAEAKKFLAIDYPNELTGVCP